MKESLIFMIIGLKAMIDPIYGGFGYDRISKFGDNLTTAIQPMQSEKEKLLNCIGKCEKDLTEVCGTDGKMYYNSCYAFCHKIEVKYKSKCSCEKECEFQPENKICGADQKVYRNLCELGCKNIPIAFFQHRGCCCTPDEYNTVVCVKIDGIEGISLDCIAKCEKLEKIKCGSIIPTEQKEIKRNEKTIEDKKDSNSKTDKKETGSTKENVFNIKATENADIKPSLDPAFNKLKEKILPTTDKNSLTEATQSIKDNETNISTNNGQKINKQESLPMKNIDKKPDNESTAIIIENTADIKKDQKSIPANDKLIPESIDDTKKEVIKEKVKEYLNKLIEEKIN